MNMLYIIKKIFSSNKKPNYVNRIMIKMVNKSRRKRGLSDVVYDESLKNHANSWSKHMSHQGYLSHSKRIMENACYIYDSYKRLTSKEVTIKMFYVWKSSVAGHWEWMMHPNTYRVGFGYYRSKNGKIYGSFAFNNP